MATSQPDQEGAVQKWLTGALNGVTDRKHVCDLLLQAWWVLAENKPVEPMPSEDERRAGWRETVRDKSVEIGWLARQSSRQARFEPLTLSQVGL